MNTSIAEIVDNFRFLDDWDDKYRYLIELGRGLEPLPDEAHKEANRVRGCASQVWLQTRIEKKDGVPHLYFLGDSDAVIVKGLVALALAIYSGRPAADIVETDALDTFRALGLAEHLTPQRSNGLRSMVERIRRDARAALASVD